MANKKEATEQTLETKCAEMHKDFNELLSKKDWSLGDLEAMHYMATVLDYLENEKAV